MEWGNKPSLGRATGDMVGGVGKRSQMEQGVDLLGGADREGRPLEKRARKSSGQLEADIRR